MSIPIGVLDQSPVLAGADATQAVHATLDLARAADRWDYARYWVAEHHAMRGLADAAPEILVARIAAETQRIRVGTGGVLLPHYSALKVAEQFRMLETLTPGRIDLGVGRAPGGTTLVSAALGTREVRDFPRQLDDLRGYLRATIPTEHRFASLPAMPAGPSAPEVWLLGSSDYSAALAAEAGLPYAFAHFISGDAQAETRFYRRNFMPSADRSAPRVLLAVGAIAAETADEAEELAAVIDLWRLGLHRGGNRAFPTLAQARAYSYTEHEREQIRYDRRRLTVGSAQGVRDRLEALALSHEADELMVVTIAPDYASRMRSYELLAGAFATVTFTRASERVAG